MTYEMTNLPAGRDVRKTVVTSPEDVKIIFSRLRGYKKKLVVDSLPALPTGQAGGKQVKSY